MPCSGPDNTAWDGTTCTGSPHQTSCDSVGQQTCTYAFGQVEEEVSYCAGVLNAIGHLKVNVPGPLEKIGVVEGQWITSLNGSPVTVEAMDAFTPTNPATVIAGDENQPGLWSLTLEH